MGRRKITDESKLLERKLKNRESARLSILKKKAKMDALYLQKEQLTKQNKDLEDRIKMLEMMINSLYGSYGNKRYGDFDEKYDGVDRRYSTSVKYANNIKIGGNNKEGCFGYGGFNGTMKNCRPNGFNGCEKYFGSDNFIDNVQISRNNGFIRSEKYFGSDSYDGKGNFQITNLSKKLINEKINSFDAKENDYKNHDNCFYDQVFNTDIGMNNNDFNNEKDLFTNDYYNNSYYSSNDQYDIDSYYNVHDFNIFSNNYLCNENDYHCNINKYHDCIDDCCYKNDCNECKILSEEQNSFLNHNKLKVTTEKQQDFNYQEKKCDKSSTDLSSQNGSFDHQKAKSLDLNSNAELEYINNYGFISNNNGTESNSDLEQAHSLLQNSLFLILIPCSIAFLRILEDFAGGNEFGLAYMDLAEDCYFDDLYF